MTQNYCSEKTKRTGGIEVISSLTNQKRVPARSRRIPLLWSRKSEPEPISSTEESEDAKSSSNFPIVDLKDYDIAQKTILYIQDNHVIENEERRSRGIFDED